MSTVRKTGAEVADEFAKSLSDSTDLDPIAVRPRGQGFVQVEGYDSGNVAVRAIFSPNGSLFGAWDPDDYTDECPGCGRRPAIACCELGRER